MRRARLERLLREGGAMFVRHGKKHDIWRGPTGQEVSVPRHVEINEWTARAILRETGVRTTR